MALFSVKNIEIKGVASSVPKKIVKTKDYSGFTSAEKKMFEKTVGIAERRMAVNGVTISDLCFEAAEKLLDSLKWRKSEIDILILVTQLGDYNLPATSIILQNRLGLSQKCLAFDINLGCSGYVYGLSVISSMLSSGQLKKGLLLAGDVSTSAMNFHDKSTYPMFGDAGTATAVEFSQNAEGMKFNLQSNGKGFDAIIIPDGGLRNPINESTFTDVKDESGLVRNNRNLWLNGIDVFNFSLKEVGKNISALLQENDNSKDEIDFFVLHQANRLINESIRKKMKIKPEFFPYSIGNFGNTSSASIPLTITTRLSDKLSSDKKKLIFCGFGVGLSWGSMMLSTNKLNCVPLIEI